MTLVNKASCQVDSGFKHHALMCVMLFSFLWEVRARESSKD